MHLSFTLNGRLEADERAVGVLGRGDNFVLVRRREQDTAILAGRGSVSNIRDVLAGCQVLSGAVLAPGQLEALRDPLNERIAELDAEYAREIESGRVSESADAGGAVS